MQSPGAQSGRVSVKAIMLGVAGVGGVGAAAYMGTGGGPDDFIGHVNKSPQAVYAAFSALGPAGEISLPGARGWGSGVKQRIVKVANEQIKIEVEINGETLVSAEVQLSPEGDGTRIAAELDFNSAAMNELVKEAGGPPVPTFAFEEYLLDQAFAHAMREAVERIEEGKPLLSLAATRARWGSDSSSRGSTSGTRSSGTWEQRQAVRPQMDARPTLNPNAAARQQMNTRPDSYD
jgi:hypothetical protein